MLSKEKFDDVISKLVSFYKKENPNVTALDLTKKEDYDTFIDIVDEVLHKFKNSIFMTDETLEFFNSLKFYAKEIYDKANITYKKPSDMVDSQHKEKFMKLVNEYVDEKIKPAAILSDKQINSVTKCLFEFACWIYLR